MAIAERRAVSTLQDGDYILVLLLTLAQDEVADPTFMATATPCRAMKYVLMDGSFTRSPNANGAMVTGP